MGGTQLSLFRSPPIPCPPTLAPPSSPTLIRLTRADSQGYNCSLSSSPHWILNPALPTLKPSAFHILLSQATHQRTGAVFVMLDPGEKDKGGSFSSSIAPSASPPVDWKPGVMNPDQVQACVCESERLCAGKICLSCTG